MELPESGQSVTVTIRGSLAPVSMHFQQFLQFGHQYEVFINAGGGVFRLSDIIGWAPTTLMDGIEYFYIDPSKPSAALACAVDDVRHYAASPWNDVVTIGIREMHGGRIIERPGYVGSPRLMSHRDYEGFVWVDKPFTTNARDWLTRAMETLKKMNKNTAP